MWRMMVALLDVSGSLDVGGWLDGSVAACERVLDVSVMGCWRESKTAWWSGGETITVVV